jgi:hypothetical protein
MSPARLVTGAVAALVALTACGGSSGDTAPTVGSAESTQVSAPATEVTVGEVVTSDPIAPATTIATTTTTQRTGPPVELADLDAVAEITVTTPVSGNGEHPLLAWAPVESAATYTVTLHRLDGEPYWAWTGAESQIWLGGFADAPEPDVDGPFLAESMTLRVVAFDTETAIIAASRAVDIAP